jgi:serine/threonine protein kinase/formylglycine-generating enzyme required for sulfatase activity
MVHAVHHPSTPTGSSLPSLSAVDHPTIQFSKPRPGDTIGSYRLLREVGSGSSGIVYLAEVVAPATGADAPSTSADEPHRVAIKVLRPQRLTGPAAAARFLRAAELVSRAAGPNICPIEASGTHAGLPYLVLRHLEGSTLAEAIQRRRPLPPQEQRRADDRLLRQFEKLARALHHLHQQRITHRDVKPNNILIDPSGEPWLLDFGLMVTEDDSTRQIAGSPAYLAPELLRGDGAPGVATDLYAFGVTLFEAATGRLPYPGRSAAELLSELAAGKRPTARRLVRGLPADLDVVLDRLLQTNPADRYPDGAAVADDLRRVRERLPLPLRRVPLVTRLRRWLRSNPLPAAVLGVLTASSVGLGWLLVDYRRALRLNDLLASRSLLAAAQRSAAELLPATEARLPEVRRWLLDHDGPDGLGARRERLQAALGSVPPARQSEAAVRVELEAELRTVEHIPRWVDALGDAPKVIAAIPALMPALERHRAVIESSLDAAENDVPAGVATETERVNRELAALLAELAEATGPHGVVVRMRREREAIERAIASRRDAEALWRESIAAVATKVQYAADSAAGFRLHPQSGLLPLGADPDSGLEEFALLRSGDPPRRGVDGRFAVTPSDAIVFVLLPGGTVSMGATSEPGSPNWEWQARPPESPVAEVPLTPFLLAKYELTQAQWRRLGGRPTNILRTGDRIAGIEVTDQHPAEGMSFAAAEQLLHANGLALPTEAQWEHAARLAASQPSRELPANLILPDGYPFSHAPVGSFPADRCGLHELHGNVAEMVADRYGNYDLASPRAGDGLRRGWRIERVTRGGGFLSESDEARAACRFALPDFGLLPFVGLRPTRPLDAR